MKTTDSVPILPIVASALLALCGCGRSSVPTGHSVVTVFVEGQGERCRIEDERLSAEFNVRCRDVVRELRGGRQLPSGAIVAVAASGDVPPEKIGALEAALQQAHYRVGAVISGE